MALRLGVMRWFDKRFGHGVDYRIITCNGIAPSATLRSEVAMDDHQAADTLRQEATTTEGPGGAG